MEAEKTTDRVPIRELVRYYLRLGVLGFGGPVALVGQMERELVGDKKWLSKEEMREGIAVRQSLPGPLAIQVGIWISYIRGGFWGAWAGGWAFILPNFVIVAAMGALYVHFGGLPWVTAIFYGVSPAVIALILHSCYRLTKLGMKDWLEWVLAAAAFAITVAVQAEVALVFIGCGIVGVIYYGFLVRARAAVSTTRSVVLGVPLVAAGAAPATVGEILSKLLAFFLKAGSLTFGSGLVIVPFLEKGLVQQTGWLSEREFLVAVAMGMISPGPVVITATSSATSSPPVSAAPSLRASGAHSCRRSVSSCHPFCWSLSLRRSSSDTGRTHTCRGSSRAPTPQPSARFSVPASCSERLRSATGSPRSSRSGASLSCSAGRLAIPCWSPRRRSSDSSRSRCLSLNGCS